MIRRGRAMSPCVVESSGILPTVMPRTGLMAFDRRYRRGLCSGRGNRSPMSQYAAMARCIDNEWLAGDKTP